MFYVDPMYFLFILPPLLLMLFAQARVRGAFTKYSQVPNQRGLSGAEVARAILDANGLSDVPVEMVPGELTDHYDPRERALRLSPPVFQGRSVAAIGIAAHEAGHALQHKAGYLPLQIRSLLVPAASLGSNLGWIMILAGIVIGLTQLAWLGIAFFAAGTLFALVTLPVEFDASNRALQMLTTMGIVDRTEYQQNREVLNAAALTYIAGFLTALMQLLYWLSIVSGMNRRD
ncbi:zinc metallopeptidase [Sphaerobacter thermophilus]|uniref:Peptidase membrane zinc metallopeptidase putative n=1 Tax=Sphaerobacter thermophilus (strain ATCC 49802 / DSM 20745 / KCCM 41009 / NCIMB 13125 / S 6022) TaxID=479434 RepID=D1C3K6_SPHTD|nr:zinc metallopeptidase [Sphaerobacter thermophilus]ACZ38823.1 peptidase membrane zinc metallopeptidase putative [Sphaerobacter thermophilus DSM 20745]